MSRTLKAGIFAVLFSVPSAHAALEERLGVLEVSDLFLEPSFHYFETRTGGFEAGNSLLSIRWLRDENIAAIVTMGTRDLVGRPRRYRAGTEAEFTLAEAFIEAHSSFGDIRFGRVPLPFGTESGRGEARLRLPRSMLFREAWIGLRDQGLAYAIENKGFFSEWSIHNGEGGPDLDNQIWFTARWGWQGGDGIYTGFSGAAGRTTTESTQDSTRTRTTALSGIDPDQSSKNRFGNLFFEWDGLPFGALIEGTFGETEQARTIQRLRAGHVDLSYTISRRLGLLARYDILDPNDRTQRDRQDETSIGFSLKGRYSTSALYVFATKTHIEGSAQDRHEAMVVWRLTPLARSPR